MKIRSRTIELLARDMGDAFTGSELVRFLKECGVPKELIVYPNTKWKVLYGVMHALSSSEDQAKHSLLYKIITSFVHPLSFGGDENTTKEVIKRFNDWLIYDDLEISWIGKNALLGKPFVQVDVDDEEIEQAIEEVYQGAFTFIKTYHMNDLILFKKSYQLLINIVDIFFEDTSHLDEKLNEYYLTLCEMARKLGSKIHKSLKGKVKNYSGVSISAIDAPDTIYRPFRNLYSAKVEHEGLGNWSKGHIKDKMNEYFGEILQLCIDCQAGDIVATKDSQQLFNDVSLYLTGVKEKKIQEKQAIGLSKQQPVTFDKQKSLIVLHGKEIKIPFGKNQYYLCEALFGKLQKNEV